MGYANHQALIRDLEARGMLLRVAEVISPNQEIAAVQRRLTRAGGPAVLCTNVTGTDIPMLANLYGTMERMRFIFRETLATVEAILAAKADPFEVLRRPWRYLRAPLAPLNTLPKLVGDGPALARRTSLAALPQLRSWPQDGGGYVTLPLVYSESPESPGFKGSNLGMYRVQLSGNEFDGTDAGLHYQIHRGIGHHHAEAIRRGEPLKVLVCVGGPPALTLSAVMPLPDGVPEVFFAGLLAGFRIPFIKRPGHLPVPAEADFVIEGEVHGDEVKSEGPFGDHLGYYSLAHDFPRLRVSAVHRRADAVWPFTTVGRPPQEDTVFGDFIHELTSALVPTVFSGVREVHAVDAAGVHPLLLAVGSERYVPFAADRQPQELLTNGFALLGSTQTSLSKYVLIAAKEDSPPPTRDVPAFLAHLLTRVDLSRDLHFVTRTTMDTLDYSGISLNQGSKLLLAAAGPPRRELATELPAGFRPPAPFGNVRLFAPGIAVLEGPPHDQPRDAHDPLCERLTGYLGELTNLAGLPLVILTDDAAFTCADWENFLWIVFTRSDPATDIYGAHARTHCKHWGCQGPLVIDARLKRHHAPPLEEDPEAAKKAEALAAPGGPLHGVY